MVDDEERNPSAETGADGSAGSPPTVWVIGAGTEDCAHPPDRLDRLGGDGVNGYHHCEDCAAVLVIADEVTHLSKNATDDPDETG